MKYKVGDIVKVKDDLVKGQYYGKKYFGGMMAEYKGKKLKVRKIELDEFYVLEGARSWYWTEEMVEGINK